MPVLWDVAPPPPQPFVDALPTLHRLTAAVLFSRGYSDPERALAFVQGKFDPVDPFVLKDMDRAVARITAAVNAGEAIAIYGDYDCDGVTSCALLMRALGSLNARVRVYLPNRFDEGYGLNSGALDKLNAEGVTLVITVDCGARAVREAAHARAIGLDLIITDHHEPDPHELPGALALVNPKRPDCAYPYKQLAGVGVTFRLAQALLRTLKRPGCVSERSLLDLVALGTVADVVSMTGENRLLVRAGLDVINSAPVPGIAALMRSAGVKPGTVDAGKIGFMLAPRLNAAGRLDDARAAYELLICDEIETAESLASQLSLQNEQRQLLTASMADDAEVRALQPDPDAPLLFAADDGYNAGVIGLAAARLVERYYRPAVVVAIHNGEARGSCRSVHGFHMTQALDACAALLSKHGGHAAAAGFTLPTERLTALRDALTAEARSAQPEHGWQKIIKVAAEVELADVSAKAYAELCKLEPHGPENPRPVFASRRVAVVEAKRIGKSESGIGPHLKIKLRDGRRTFWDAVFWRAGERQAELREGACIDVAFQLDENEWNGRKNLQLVVQDFVASA
jgi:single-stranded-DNA-specific exonuclease